MIGPTSETEEQLDAGVIKLKQQKSSEINAKHRYSLEVPLQPTKRGKEREPKRDPAMEQMTGLLAESIAATNRSVEAKNALAQAKFNYLKYCHDNEGHERQLQRDHDLAMARATSGIHYDN